MAQKDNKKDLDNDFVDEEIVSDKAELDDATIVVKSSQKLKKLREKLKTAEKEKRDFHEELQRSKADFLNSRRRLEEQCTSDKEREVNELLVELLTLADSFETAKADEKLWNSVEETWRNGIDAIYSKLTSILLKYETMPITPLGEKFNPKEHEALSNKKVEDEAQIDTVIKVMQKGYKRKNKIIRPASVIVGTK